MGDCRWRSCAHAEEARPVQYSTRYSVRQDTPEKLIAYANGAAMRLFGAREPRLCRLVVGVRLQDEIPHHCSCHPNRPAGGAHVAGTISVDR
jgi:hypothetical protein